MKYCNLPIVRDEDHDLSGRCKKIAGLPQLDRIHRTLPTRTEPSGDPDVLQDEAGAPILDEINGTQIYDDLRV